MAVTITLNGQPRELALASGSNLLDLVSLLNLKADQVAVEQNGQIIRRTQWAETALTSGDRLEVVQFVGGGCAAQPPVVCRSSASQRLP